MDPNPSRYSILIVDDVPKNIQLVAKFLTQEGYQLFFAQSGAQALDQLKEHKFDLILLDIMMPEMDGFEVCRRIKSDPANAHLPVIFLTAKTDEESIARGFSTGGVDYVTKPFNPVELLARVKTHLQLRKRETELMDLNKTKDTLLSIISHDLKTPFFNILGLGELMLTNYGEYDDAMKRELIQNMIDAARSSHNLLDNLLNWIRMQTGKLNFNPSAIDLQQVVGELLELMSQPIKNKEIQIVTEILCGSKIYSDVNMINTIMRNLLSNAVKYSYRRGTIEIRCHATEQIAEIEIADEGIGIPADKLEKLFVSGKQESIPGTEQEPGSGYGLMVTHDFIEACKGKITVYSKPGKGTRFCLELPLAPPI